VCQAGTFNTDDSVVRFEHLNANCQLSNVISHKGPGKEVVISIASIAVGIGI
jgi:hypothetical protein